MFIARSFVNRKSALALGLVAWLGSAMACKGTRGILLDIWSWDEVSQRTDSAVIYIHEGILEIVAYPRKNVWVQRHVYCFEGSLKTAEYTVENRVLDLVFDVDGPALCFGDHWLEVPEKFPIDMTVDTGIISLFGTSGPLTITAGAQLEVYGEELESPTVNLQANDAKLVTLSFKVAPTSVVLSGHAENVEILLPPGNYRCGTLPANTVVDPAIVCDPAASSSLDLSIITPALTVALIVP